LTSSLKQKFEIRDVCEIAVGATVMAFPVSVTQEVWDLGTELSLARVSLFAVASIIFLAVLIYFLHGTESNDGQPETRSAYFSRVLTTYGLTLLIACLLLFGIDRLELFTDPLVGLKRALLVAFPASFAATVVDGLSGSSK